jgi:hypothetical protein
MAVTTVIVILSIRITTFITDIIIGSITDHGDPGGTGNMRVTGSMVNTAGTGFMVNIAGTGTMVNMVKRFTIQKNGNTMGIM